ncbi:MAG: thioredoxin family protein [Muribaculaceae bacterium]|nr:thioredoxin family protein [Muribaculaceae bacterium]
MRKIAVSLLTLLLSALALCAANIEKPVTWSVSIENKTADGGTLLIKGDIKEGWHIYGIEMPELSKDAGVPDPTRIEFTSGAQPDGPLSCNVEPTTHFDAFMNLNLPWLSGSIELRQPFRLTEGNLEGIVRYMACTEQSCTPPARFDFSIPMGERPASADTASQAQPEASPTAKASKAAEDYEPTEWWAPVEVERETASQSFWAIFIFGFLGGLVALMTPCVWPMIPMTVSFFLKKNKSRRRSIIDAVVYSGSIILIFLILGIVLTLIFGPGKLNEIATGAVFNLIFFALLVFFAISFFGAFEIALPSRWSNAIDEKAENTTGILSIFFMAFTLVLVSFSCTGPIIGTLLVEAFSQSNLLGPLAGMGGFALGLALPFGLFAFFPSMLKELPRSGSWLNTVKVVLGFIELILSLKFLSVADLAYGWRILDREVFLSIWIVLFALLGIYLLGKLRFSHDNEIKHTSVGRFFLAVASFSFAIYLVPGLWGAPLKAISAFAPPLYTQDFNLYGGTFEEFHDYDEGMAYAQAHGKPVLLDFSGYACVNCRKMEGAVFDNASVRSIIENDFVMIKLMVDDKASLDRPMTVTEEGQTMRLTTVGEKWAYLQRYKFGINSQPYYVILDNAGKPLEAPRVYDENIGAFVGWLENGAANYKK